MISTESISIVVPVYKVPEEMLHQCIKSILNQTYENIEIILVDDGSPDNCPKICDDYSRKDSRVIVVHQENKGLCGARNSGMNRASSKWIMFVDGDDWIESDLCDRLISYSKLDTDIVCGGYVKDYQGIVIKKEYSSFIETEKVYYTDYDLKYLKRTCLRFDAYISSCCAKIYKREFLIGNDLFFDDSLRQGAEGIEFIYRVFDAAKKVVFIDCYCYHYMENNNSITTTPNVKNAEMILACFNKMERYIDDDEIKNVLYTRVLYSIISVTINIFFNPNLNIKYKERKRIYIDFLSNEIIFKAMNNEKNPSIDYKRKIIYYLIKYKLFFLIYILTFFKIKNRG